MNTTKNKASRGRPKRKPEYNKEQQIQDMIEHAVQLFSEPYDDRQERRADAPSITTVAAKMHTSRIRVRKMLITADYYSTKLSRQISDMTENGKSIEEISAETGLGRAAVHSYIPYERGVYNLTELSVNAEQCRLFQRRKKACEKLRQYMSKLFQSMNRLRVYENSIQNWEDCRGKLSDKCSENLWDDCCENIWETILSFEHYPLVSEDGRKIRYSIEEETIYFECKIITRKCVETVLFRICHMLAIYGSVTEKEFCKYGGTPELYALFLRIGACSR